MRKADEDVSFCHLRPLIRRDLSYNFIIFDLPNTSDIGMLICRYTSVDEQVSTANETDPAAHFCPYLKLQIKTWKIAMLR